MFRLRQLIAVSLALVVTLVTLGRVRVNWTGRPSAVDGVDDPGRPAATAPLDRALTRR